MIVALQIIVLFCSTNYTRENEMHYRSKCVKELIICTEPDDGWKSWEGNLVKCLKK